MKRDKVHLDIFWLRDRALERCADLPAPKIIAADLEATLEQFATIAEDLSRQNHRTTKNQPSIFNTDKTILARCGPRLTSLSLWFLADPLLENRVDDEAEDQENDDAEHAHEHW